MPSEHNFPPLSLPSQQDLPLQQDKLCSSCHSPLVDSIIYLRQPVCSVCQGRPIFSRVARRQDDSGHALCSEADNDLPRRVGPDETLHLIRRTNDPHFHTDTNISSSSSPPSSPLSSTPPPEAPYNRLHVLSSIKHSPLTGSLPPSFSHHSHTDQSVNTARRHEYSNAICPDPLVDITRLRVRSQGHHCLYPGASFRGTQKSGRNSYDVNVTIVDVDFSSSTLCGYLRIRGLTDDWPELTTYFDAEIIGSRYGFLTQNWGANEQEDMVHWQRFPAFRHVKHELKKPHLTMSDRDRGAVFMRWKERFLVPDHRVQDINGASFAGFYYVCVDFNPQPVPPTSRQVQQLPLTPEHENVDPPAMPTRSTMKAEAPQRVPRESNVRRSERSPSVGLRTSSTPVATMSGFYFHQNSEPYQQLSLCHVPERTTSTFEFR